MLTVEYPADMARHVGEKHGPGEWLLVDQAMIDAFAQATGDMNWIHVDVERAKREVPGGKTIAHGYLTLSLVPRLSRSVYQVRQRIKAFNYGANRIRFTAPVPVGSRIRLSQTLTQAEITDNGARLTFACTVEIEGSDRPAMVADIIVLIS